MLAFALDRLLVGQQRLAPPRLSSITLSGKLLLFKFRTGRTATSTVNAQDEAVTQEERDHGT